MGYTSHVKELVRPIASRVWNSRLYAQTLMFGDVLVQKIASFSRETFNEQKYSILLTPAGEGNIGDHAMLNAYLEQTQGPLIILSGGDGREVSLSNPLIAQRGSEIKVIPGRRLYTLPPVLRIPDVYRFSRLLRNAEAFHIQGADTMDGSQLACSLARFSLCNLAIRQGAQTEILGFSWRENVAPNVADALRALSPRMTLKSRDPESTRRMNSLGASNVKSLSDTVFSSSGQQNPPRAVEAWIDACVGNSGRYMVLNVSGLVAKKMKQTDEIGAVVKAAHDCGVRVLFLPHVIRDGDDDLSAVREAYSKFALDTDLLVSEQLTPEQVRYVTARAAVTVTGRMHLSILSLTTGTPAIALATAGKVEGLFGMFGMHQFVVQVKPGFGAAVAESLIEAIRSNSQLREQIEQALVGVRAASLENFSGLPNFKKFATATDNQRA